MTPQKFRNLVWKFYEREGRHDLPWRKTRDSYRILVSEVMLQQTQVERVRGYYTDWMKRFPTVAALAEAPLADVLRQWQGLGYNRRAKMLHEAAKQIVKEYKGKLPKTAAELEGLPGIGPYTARAVAAFAYDTPDVFIETNLRTVIIHHYFSNSENSASAQGTTIYHRASQASVPDVVILEVLKRVLPKDRVREWYWALMDYGSHLKRRGVKTHRKSASYTKQTAFKGSVREARGAILKELAQRSASKERLAGLLGDDRRKQMEEQLAKLTTEGFITRKGARFELAS